MILVLGNPSAAPPPGITPAPEPIERLEAPSLEEALEAVRRTEPRCVVACLPLDGLNPFALARALGRLNGPPVWLVGALRREQRFWAERSGARVVERLEQATGIEGIQP